MSSKGCAYILGELYNEVVVIDTAINKESDRIYRDNVSGGGGIAISPEDKYAYVICSNECSENNGKVFKIDTSINKVLGNGIFVGVDPCTIDIKPDGRFAYITDRDGFVRFVDLLYWRVYQYKVSAGPNPTKLKREPYNKWLYVINHGAGSVTAINFADYNIKETIGIGGYPQDLTTGFIPGDEEVDLSITKTGEPNPVKTGNELTYTMVVQNNGQATATNVQLIDTLPLTVNYVSSKTCHGTCDFKDGVVKCNLLDINPGQTKTVEIIVVPEKVGTITNSATVTSFETDSNPSNNTSIEQTTVLANSACIETTRIFDSSTQQYDIRNYIDLPCTDWHQSIYSYINDNKQYSSCSIKFINCSIQDVTELNEDRIYGVVKVEGVVILEISDGNNFNEKYEKEFSSFGRFFMLYAPKGSNLSCTVEKVCCEIYELIDCTLKYIINAQTSVETKAVVKMKVPYLGDC